MSSADSSLDRGTTVPVAPREIVDLVTRILRVHGVDPASATGLARDVMRCQAHGHPAVPMLLSALDDGSIAELTTPHDPAPTDPAAILAAQRIGIPLDESVFRALERGAADFLVAEHLLDAVADEPPVD